MPIWICPARLIARIQNKGGVLRRGHADHFRPRLPHGRTQLARRRPCQIPAGAKVALVGRNGAGKSTLLDLIRGALHPDGGDIQMPRDYRIGFLAQEAPGGAAPPLDTVLAADTERSALLAELDGAPPLR